MRADSMDLNIGRERENLRSTSLEESGQERTGVDSRDFLLH